MLFHTPPFTKVCQNGTALDDAIVSKANSINLDTGVYSDSRETASNEDLIWNCEACYLYYILAKAWPEP